MITTIDQRGCQIFWLFVGHQQKAYEMWCHELGEWEEELTGFHNSVEEINKGGMGIHHLRLLKSTLLQHTSQGWEAERVLGNLSVLSALLFSEIFCGSDKDRVAWLSKPLKGGFIQRHCVLNPQMTRFLPSFFWIKVQNIGESGMFTNAIRQHFYMKDTKSNRVFVFIASRESKSESFCGSVPVAIWGIFSSYFRE